MIEGEVLKRYELSLDDILPQIMETIIEVYGERHRKQIENNFKRAYLNSYITYDRIKSDYNKKLNLCRTKISLDFLKKRCIVSYNTNLDYTIWYFIGKYRKTCGGLKCSETTRKPETGNCFSAMRLRRQSAC